MSKPIRIGINGFGRIGRKIARLALNNDNIEIAAINDLGDINTLAHLLKYDSVHGILPEDVSVSGNELHVGSKRFNVFSERDPAKLAWGENNIPVIHESTGIFTDHEKASLHLKGGAKKVLISAPSKDPDQTICMGVNHETYDPAKHNILSNASCTTNCLAPLVKVLDSEFGVKRGTMLTIHSYTNDQKILDLPHKDLRRARAAAMSMIPTSTGAAKAVGLVLPHLNGKLDGFAIRVPTPNVSVVDFVGELEKPTTEAEVNAAFKKAAEGELSSILGYTEEPLVSVDFNGNPFSSVVDSQMTKVIEGSLVKVLSWYDNESGFSQRMLDLTLWIGQKGF